MSGPRLTKEFIEDRVDIDRVSGCWIWIHSTNRTGYAVGPNRASVHRESYMLWNGPIPDGAHIDHRTPPCTSRACVNPDHLEAVTKGANTSRGQTVRRGQMSKKNLRASSWLHQQVSAKIQGGSDADLSIPL